MAGKQQWRWSETVSTKRLDDFRAVCEAMQRFDVVRSRGYLYLDDSIQCVVLPVTLGRLSHFRVEWTTASKEVEVHGMKEL